ncbi:60s acidic ribosomal protein P2 [Clonorchis sinensis]|uniref:Large ribosomal subunit protein P2 n=1 Tax=Clonorchis sinensis TaxID=79923 RepID=A0A3R7C8K2_CLOSI|nr:60s acidic ribosomal protein P2 [Clonorchis sinensis]KAG5445034.1 60s acidic ribosomal protein P2 [Clonorchis sinensis]
MRYLAAYMLCQLGGKERPTAADIQNILSSVGIEHESDRISKLLSELEGKDITKLIAEGRMKMASVPMGGGGAPVAAAAAPAAAAPGAPAPEAAKKEAPKEEKKEESESEDDMGFGLFD